MRTDYTDADLTFYLQVYRDVARAAWCLTALRQHFPHARVLVVSDGDRDLRYAALRRRFGVEFRLGERLYPRQYGGRMIERMLRLWNTQTDFLFKIDPDALVQRRFQWLPAEPLALFGDCQPLQGGCVGYTRQAGQRLLDSGLLADPVLTQPEQSWALLPDGSLHESLWTDISISGLVRTDWIIAWCCRRLDIPQVGFPEIYSRWREPVPDGLDVAVSHPHKHIPIERDEL